MREINERPMCHRAEDLVAYLYNEASEAEAKDFASHVEQCDACRSELRLFRQVHESISIWRNETLGSISNSMPNTAVEVAPQSSFVQHEQELSAMAALREFFSVAPLWLRGATAFAAMLLFVFGFLAISRSLKPPVPASKNSAENKVYSPAEFQAAVDEAVKKKLAAQQAEDQMASKENEKNAQAQSENLVSQTIRGTSARHSRRQPALSRAEREQLAADLRLIPGRDETDLPIVFTEEPNEE